MLGETDKPISVKLVAQDINPLKLLAVGLLTLAPVAIAVLMQNPALRQALQLKAWNACRTFARRNAQAWSKVESLASTRYDIARL